MVELSCRGLGAICGSIVEFLAESVVMRRCLRCLIVSRDGVALPLLAGCIIDALSHGCCGQLISKTGTVGCAEVGVLLYYLCLLKNYYILPGSGGAFL